MNRLAAFALALAAAAVLHATAETAPAWAGSGNASIPSASGPLVAGQSYSGGVRAAGDRAFYFFYVTSPGDTPITLTAANLGGDSGLSGINATIVDSSATPVASMPYLGDGESRTLSVGLAAQKYFVEIAPSEGFGDAYGFSVGAAGEVVGPYASIARRCADAANRTAAARTGLLRAEAKLQRTTARLQRSRFGTAATRRAALAAQRRAQAGVAAAGRALKAARAARNPWCSIAE